jgi:hypothetical protein
MAKKVKKGDTFVCIKKVVMDGDCNFLVYRKGFIYNSEEDGCITNDEKERFHQWKSYNKVTKEHFLKIKNR